MTLNEMHVAFKEDANHINEYWKLDKTTLANGYCDADEALIIAKTNNNKKEISKQSKLKSAYFSALMVRYWYKIFDWMQNSGSLNLSSEEFASWLSDSLYVAFYYRMWRYKYKAEVKEGKFIDWKYDENGDKIENPYYYEKDPTAVDKIINRCCLSMRGRVYQFHNKDKRRINVQSLSIDKMMEDVGDGFMDDILENEVETYEDNPPMFQGAYQLVSTFLQRGESIEALIVDGIAHRDSFKNSFVQQTDKLYDEDSGEYYEDTHKAVVEEFNERKLIHHLATINQSFMRRFCQEYDIDSIEGEKILEELQSLSNYKLYKYIKKTLMEIKEKPELLNCLYN